MVEAIPCVQDAFHQIVAMNPDSAEAYMLMGEALDEMKDPVGRTREFRNAAKANPKEPNVHFGLGYLLWTKGQYTEAANEFQAELDNEPQHPQAMLYLADSKIQTNQPDEARPLLEKVLSSGLRMQWRIATWASSMPNRTASRKPLTNFKPLSKSTPKT